MIKKKPKLPKLSKQPKTDLPKTIDEYIEQFSPDVQVILEKIWEVIREAAPEAKETISYQMPAFKLSGMLVYFAAWKKHIGFYPPISGDDALEKSVAPYANEKGNLLFPNETFEKPMPYNLIKRIVKLRVKQDAAKAAAKRKENR